MGGKQKGKENEPQVERNIKTYTLMTRYQQDVFITNIKDRLLGVFVLKTLPLSRLKQKIEGLKEF